MSDLFSGTTDSATASRRDEFESRGARDLKSRASELGGFGALGLDQLKSQLPRQQEEDPLDQMLQETNMDPFGLGNPENLQSQLKKHNIDREVLPAQSVMLQSTNASVSQLDSASYLPPVSVNIDSTTDAGPKTTKSSKYAALDLAEDDRRVARHRIPTTGFDRKPNAILLPHKIWLVLLFVIFILEIVALALTVPTQTLGRDFEEPLLPYTTEPGWRLAPPDLDEMREVLRIAGMTMYICNVALGSLVVVVVVPLGFVSVVRYRGGSSFYVSRLLFCFFFLFGMWIACSMILLCCAVLVIVYTALNNRILYDIACQEINTKNQVAGTACRASVSAVWSDTLSTVFVPAILTYVISLLLIVCSVMSMRLKTLVQHNSNLDGEEDPLMSREAHTVGADGETIAQLKATTVELKSTAGGTTQPPADKDRLTPKMPASGVTWDDKVVETKQPPTWNDKPRAIGADADELDYPAQDSNLDYAPTQGYDPFNVPRYEHLEPFKPAAAKPELPGVVPPTTQHLGFKPTAAVPEVPRPPVLNDPKVSPAQTARVPPAAAVVPPPGEFIQDLPDRNPGFDELQARVQSSWLSVPGAKKKTK